MTNVPTIPLDSPGGTGIPAAKFPTVGASIVVGIVNVEEAQRYSMKNEPMFWDDGKPQMYKRVTGLVVTANGAVTGLEGQEQPVQPGELVTFHCHGGRHFTWKDAVAAADGVNVGDAMQWTFTETKPPSRPGYDPQKVYVAQIRRAEPRDGDLPARCVAEYQRLQAGPQLESAGQAQPAAAPAPAAVPEPF